MILEIIFLWLALDVLRGVVKTLLTDSSLAPDDGEAASLAYMSYTVGVLLIVASLVLITLSYAVSAALSAETDSNC